MKKISRLFIVLVVFMVSVPASLAAGSLSMGGYVVNRYPVMGLQDYATATLGAGVGGEYALPVPNLSVTGRLEGTYVFDSADKVDSWIDTSFQMGVGYDIALPWQGFSFHPSIEYGMTVHMVTFADDADPSGFQSYFDQSLEVSPAFRWKTEKLTVEASPLYTVSFESADALKVLQSAGFRIGALYEL